MGKVNVTDFKIRIAATFALLTLLSLVILPPASYPQRRREANRDEIPPRQGYQRLNAVESPQLQKLLTDAIRSVTTPPGDIKQDEVAATLIDLSNPVKFEQGSFLVQSAFTRRA